MEVVRSSQSSLSNEHAVALGLPPGQFGWVFPDLRVAMRVQAAFHLPGGEGRGLHDAGADLQVGDTVMLASDATATQPATWQVWRSKRTPPPNRWDSFAPPISPAG